MISTHDLKNPDAYLRPSFSLKDKLQRVIWSVCWLMFCRWTPNPLHRWRVFVMKCFGAKLGNNNLIYPNCRIWAPWLLETEDVVTIGPGVEIYNPGGVFLGDHSILSQDAYLCGASHDFNTIEFTYVKKKIVLERYVWICAKAVVLPGVHCGEGSVLGAGAITSKNLMQWSVYAGNPARYVKERRNFLVNS